MRRNAKSKAAGLVQAGFSLIELMIAMLLGFLVVGAAGAIFMSNKRTYGATETMGRIQEGTRVSFELMSRDIREAGGNPCSSAANLVNQLEPGTDDYWTGYADGIHGYGPTEAISGATIGTAPGNRASGTDAIELHNTTQGSIRVVEHDTPSAVIDVSAVGDIEDDDILLICNMSYAFIFQVTGVNGSSLNLQHNGGSGSNCNQEFFHTREDPCTTGASGDFGYCFMVEDPESANPNCDIASNTPAYISHVQSVRWFIRINDDGTRSLVRQGIRNRVSDADAGDQQFDEIAQGVEDVDFTYLVAGDDSYVQEASVTDWRQVISVRAELTLTGSSGSLEGQLVEGTDGEDLQRQVVNVTALRNREGLQ